MRDKRKMRGRSKAGRTLAAFAIMLAVVFMPLKAEAAIPEPMDAFYVNDYAGVLTDETMDYIIEKNLHLEEASGAQIVVVTVDYSDGMDFGDYALKLFNDWGIGSASENNGMLLVLFIGDDNYYALQGRGIETIVTGGDIQQILDDVLEPYFAEKEYDEGVEKTFQAFYDILEGHYGSASGSTAGSQGTAGVSPDWREEDGNGGNNNRETAPAREKNSAGRVVRDFINIFLAIIFFAVLILILGLSSGRRRRYRGGAYYDPYPPGRPRRHVWSRWHYHRTPPPPPPGGFGMRGPHSGPGPGPGPGPRNSGRPSGGSSGGLFGGGGGSSRGGGAGRSSAPSSTSSPSRSSFSSRSSAPGRSVSRPSGGKSIGGGGSSRGGGAGRSGGGGSRGGGRR